MSSISAGLFKADTATIASNAGAITSTATTINTGTTGAITSTATTINTGTTGAITTTGTTNIYDSSGTIAYINSSLTALQASVIPPVFPYYTPPPNTATGFREAAKNAFAYAFPFLQIVGTIYQTGNWNPTSATGINTWTAPGVALTLATPVSRVATTPNVDTAYLLAIFDLTTGPAIFKIPDSSSIYYFSMQLFDAMSNCSNMISKRTIGNSERILRVVGPNQLGNGPDILRVPTNLGMVLARISYVNDPGLVKGQAFINSLVAGTIFPPKYPTSQITSKYDPVVLSPGYFNTPANWANSFKNAQISLTDPLSLPYVTDVAQLGRMSSLKLGPGFPSAYDSSSQNVNAEAIKLGISDAVTEALTYKSVTENNWGITADDIFLTQISQNYTLSDSSIIRLFLGNPKAEARYYFLYGNGTSGAFSNWSSAYLDFKVPADFVGVNGSFWSVTNYQYNDSSSGYGGHTYGLTPNTYYDPIDGQWTGKGRYAIGNFTDTSGNGNVDYTPITTIDSSGFTHVPMYLSQTPPYGLDGTSLYNNWIPLPSQPFIDSSHANVPRPPKTLNWLSVVRFYTPPESVKNGNYFPPAIQQNDNDNTIFKLTAGV